MWSLKEIRKTAEIARIVNIKNLAVFVRYVYSLFKGKKNKTLGEDRQTERESEKLKTVRIYRLGKSVINSISFYILKLT